MRFDYRTHRISLLVSVVVALGCSGSDVESPPVTSGDAAVDTSVVVDSKPIDTGSPIDAGSDTSPPDTSVPDTGASPDLGVDSNVVDTGTADAGSKDTGTKDTGTAVKDTGPLPIDAPSASCTFDSDCKLYSSYCADRPCDCIPLIASDPAPKCTGAMVACFVDPCAGRMPVCSAGTCTAGPKTGG